MRKKLRPVYANDADSITAAAHAIGVNFQRWLPPTAIGERLRKIYCFSFGCTRFQNSSKAIESKKAVLLTILPSFISMNQA